MNREREAVVTHDSVDNSIINAEAEPTAAGADNRQCKATRQRRSLQIVETPKSIAIDTGIISAQVEQNRFPDVTRLALRDNGSHAAYRIQWSLIDAKGHVRRCQVQSSTIERRHDELVVRSAGSFEEYARLQFFAHAVWLPGCGLVRFEFTLRNPGRARHRRGYWDLGDAGSVLFRSLSVELIGSATEHSRLICTTGPEQPSRDWSVSDEFELYQASSGGESWNSRNHVNWHGQVTLPFRGFRIRCGSHEEHGFRASPIVAAQQGHTWAGISIPEFWQQFPKGVSSTDGSLVAHLFPRQSTELHELQPGEQKTHEVYFALDNSEHAVIKLLQEASSTPASIRRNDADRESTRVCGLSSPTTPLRAELLQFVHSAIEGPASFFSKREVVDEYGWRHYGDLWADHEGAYYHGPEPVISHYNNQYDALQAFLLLYERTGDERWWKLADPLARHVIDIDIYHTGRDKSAYNGGLFWHTAHYHDAATATHRTMSRHMFPQGGGGGPGNEHNYSTGLLLYHQFTRSRAAHDSVVGLADWVIAMDDGRRHLLGAVCNASTGGASCTAEPAYHGPGRGAGNSLNALLDAWILTGNEHYWQYAETLIKRTIHPHDDIQARDLLNAELRWSYTVHLQSLFKFLDLAAACERIDDCYWYARESLLHYARWMVDNETFYLDHPERLEYPTETWAAQELRKGNVLLMAALHARDTAERNRFRTRADEMHDRAWNSLLGFETRHFTRPMVLALQLGLAEAGLRERLANASTAEPTPASFDPGIPNPFVSQRQLVKQAIRSPSKWPHLMLRLLRPSAWKLIASHLWITEIFRQLFASRNGDGGERHPAEHHASR